jgi:AcrR family transcriptional regulator
LNGSQTPTPTRRTELLEIGRRLFAHTGYDDLSIDEIAAEAGVAKGLLYYYFRSKRGFYLATLQAEADHLIELAQPDPQLPPAQRLRRTLDAYLAFVADGAERYRALVVSGVGADPEVRAIRDRDKVEFLRLISEAVTHRDAAPPPALRAALEGWLNFIDGVCLDWLDHRDLTTEQLRELLAAALAGALLSARAVDPTLTLDLSVLENDAAPGTAETRCPTGDEAG